ncbi:MAG: phosphoribosyltransferase [Nitrospinae bacterium]|nr:phosphoribosyltransferase [Nitrospinota bacterium]
MVFRNRAHAAHLLAEQLAEYRGEFPLVLAIPGEAVPMGKIVAEALGGELDVILLRRLRAPGCPKLAIGIVDETGDMSLDEELRGLGIGEPYLGQEKDAQVAILRKRRALYTPGRPLIDPAGRLVIVVGTSLNASSSMIAALHAVRAKHPAKLIAAAAIAAPRTLMQIAADEVVCLEAPAFFYGVEEFFRDFSEASEAEVVAILRAKPPSAATAAQPIAIPSWAPGLPSPHPRIAVSV